MRFAYVSSEDRGGVDRLLGAFAGRCLARGLPVAGIVQTNTPRGNSHRCDMDVRVLPDGPVIRISQDLGPDARGCVLDPRALEQAVAAVAAGLDDATRLLIINKFGKHEADGRGFRDVIAEAHERDIPVLVGLNRLNSRAFHAFAGGLADPLAATPEALDAWLAAEVEPGDRTGLTGAV